MTGQLHAALGQQALEVVVSTSDRTRRSVRIHPVLVCLNADTPAHAAAACALGSSALKGCSRCWVVTHKVRYITAPDGEDEIRISLPASAYCGYADETEFQKFEYGEMQPPELARLCQTSLQGSIFFDRTVAANMTVSDAMYFSRGLLAQKVIEEELRGYHAKCIHARACLHGKEADGMMPHALCGGAAYCCPCGCAPSCARPAPVRPYR